MKVSKTNKPAAPKTVKDLSPKNEVKGGIIIVNSTPSAIIDDGDYGVRIGQSNPNELSYSTR